ncbi:MAG TPA: hypothetical protein VHT05_03335 [Candidatus Elarobacter sp.]|jgi:hypothetical protein|nr:hypothetical protein [Candidatus Elarobacter sp.]
MATVPVPAKERQLRLSFAIFFALLSAFLMWACVRQWIFTLTGPAATATVTGCEPYIVNNHVDTHCFGYWTIDGRAQHGTIIGVDYGDVGKTIGVRVHEDAAYSPSLLSPIVLLLISVSSSALTVFAFLTLRTKKP